MRENKKKKKSQNKKFLKYEIWTTFRKSRKAVEIWRIPNPERPEKQITN